MAPAISSPRERSPRRAQQLSFERSLGSSWRGIPIQKAFLRFLDARVSSRHNDLYHGINTWKGWQPTASNDGTRRFVRLTSHLGPYPTTGRQWLSSSASKALKQIHHPEIGTGHGTSTNNCQGGSRWGNVAYGSVATEMECPRYVRFPPNSDRRTYIAGCLKRAKAQSRCAPARCAGARAEGPVAVERTAIAGWQGQRDQQAYCWRATHDRAR